MIVNGALPLLQMFTCFFFGCPFPRQIQSYIYILYTSASQTERTKTSLAESCQSKATKKEKTLGKKRTQTLLQW